ncbi:MAG: hypothetical protein AB7F89_10570 [Pirellulaceae bacterium]
MWCSSCQQDVPAIASTEDPAVRCARCSGELSRLRGGTPAKPLVPEAPARPTAEASAPTENATRNGSPATKARVDGPTADRAPPSLPIFFEEPEFDLDTWQWDEDLREAGRLVRSLGYVSAIDASHDAGAARKPVRTPQAAATPAAVSNRVRQPGPSTARHRILATFAWTAISLGVMASVFGGVLLAWSYAAARPELWSLGFPFALGGQAALIVGLILQLDGLAQSNQAAVTSLSDLDEQLHELRHVTVRLGNSHSGPAQSFYFHLAEGCSPHMLLADLKGQLDLLATHMAESDLGKSSRGC